MGIGEAFTRKRQALDQPQMPPARLPTGSWVPNPRNPAFTARDEDLLKLAGALLAGEEDHPAGRRMAVITGPEGIGKSQLALEFCYRYGERFERVHWLDDRSEEALATQVAQQGQALRLPNWPEKASDQFEVTLNAWQKSRQLIVFDHAPSPTDLPQWLDRLEDSQVLITSRSDNWTAESGFQVVPLRPLSALSGTALLRALSPRLRKTRDSDIERLVEQLGGSPLVLQLASSYLEERPALPPKNYQTDLEKSAGSLSPALQRWSQSSAAPRPEMLAAAFDLSVRLLDPLGGRIFSSAQFCAPEACIPFDLLRDSCVTNPTEQASFESALEKVTHLGLLTRMEAGPSIHTTLSTLARAETRAENESGQSAVNSVLAQLSKVAAGIDYLTFKTKSTRSTYEFALHLQELAPRAESAGLKTAGSLWSGLGYLLYLLGEYEQARSCLEKAILLDEANYGTVDYRVVQEYFHLGSVLYEVCDFKSARTNYQQALSIAEKAYAPNHPVIANCNKHLGQVLLEVGDIRGARDCFERALAIHEKAYGFGPKHPEVAIDASSLGKALEDLGELEQAKISYQRALEINESAFVFGREHPQVAKDLTNLGRVLRALGDQQNARTCFERVVTINEKIYGPDHAETASALNSLGRTLRDLGSLAEAQDSFERALAIDEKVYGSEHAKTAADLHNLGLVLRGMNNLLEAKTCFEKAAAIEEKIHFAEHPNVATNIHNLGRVLQEIGDFQNAKSCFERALDIDKKNYGPDHPYVATDINNLGSVMQDLKDLAGAEDCFQQALAIDEKAYGANHPNTARDINNLGSVLKAQGDLPGAREAFERALRIFESAYGPNHQKTRVVRDNLHGVLRRMG